MRRYAREAFSYRWYALAFLLVLLVVPLCGYGNAAPPTPAPTGLDRTDLVSFMAGDYTIVGKTSDSRATYSGRLTFTAHGDKLAFTRTIRGHTVRGTAVFDTVTGDRIPVLRMRFTMAGHAYEGTYQWSSDYDNYCRFTGYVYLSNGKTKSVGLEMLFPVPPSIRD